MNTDWMTTDQSIPRLAVTPGEPAGIGPDILITAIQQPFDAELIAVANPDLLKQRAALLNLPLTLVEFNSTIPSEIHRPGELKILPIDHQIKGIPGKPSPNDAGYILNTLKIACIGCLQNKFTAMVTAPVNKAVINEAGLPFTGHTEYLAEICGSGYPVMMLADQKLRVALVTTHLPLSEVSDAITYEKLKQVINIVWYDLHNRFDIQNPNILVCGLNPHAGENGYLGMEEKNIIIPALEDLRQNGLRLTGPVPADTAFNLENLQTFDVIVTMYHDQGLPVLKSRGFGEIVNITLGLPIIRTSVDHGTALSLAGTGQGNCSSLTSAINCAISLSKVNERQNHKDFFSTKVV